MQCSAVQWPMPCTRIGAVHTRIRMHPNPILSYSGPIPVRSHAEEPHPSHLNTFHPNRPDSLHSTPPRPITPPHPMLPCCDPIASPPSGSWMLRPPPIHSDAEDPNRSHSDPTSSQEAKITAMRRAGLWVDVQIPAHRLEAPRFNDPMKALIAEFNESGVACQGPINRL